VLDAARAIDGWMTPSELAAGAFDEAELERFNANTSPYGPIEPVPSDTLTAAARFSEHSVADT
jgi:hypothetical protein